MQLRHYLNRLKQCGYRITALRHAFLDVIISASHPLDYHELVAALNEKSLHPNKTSIYRELDVLLGKEIIQEIDLGEGKKRYELAGEHHHHLVCTGCDTIAEVHLDDHLISHEQKILQEKNFQVTRHMLEFFGLCSECREPKKGSQ